MKTVHIMRGLPGSGKSTYVRHHFPHSIVCSADDYFMRWDPHACASGGGWVYAFEVSKKAAAHAWCREYLKMQLDAGAEELVVDNSNILISDVEHYATMAVLYGYRVDVIRLEVSEAISIARNVHRVPPEVIRSMHLSFEDYPGERLETDPEAT